MERIPGLIPVAWVTKLLKKPERKTVNWFVYICVSDVALDACPERWDFQTLSIFKVDPIRGKPGEAVDMLTDEPIDSLTAAAVSAALPILVRPFVSGAKRLLDGGLVANLPAGYIASNGSLGGGYILCIIPRSLDDLDRKSHIDHRVLRFLNDLKKSQFKHRNVAASRVTSTGPAHTHTAVMLITPKVKLGSGLILGLVAPWLLRRDFARGLSDAGEFVLSLRLFSEGSSSALDQFLLDNARTEIPEENRATLGVWRLWANFRWR